MMGFTATGKSTLALRLSKIMNTDLFHSAVTRKNINLSPEQEEAADEFFDLRSSNRKAMDKIVYAENRMHSVQSLKKRKDVILDAGHFFKSQRELIYHDTLQYRPEIFIIRTVCGEDEIIKRLNKRLKDFNKSHFNETPSFRAYESCKAVTEYPDGSDILPSGDLPVIIEVDTSKGDINIKQDGKNINKIEEILNAIKSAC